MEASGTYLFVQYYINIIMAVLTVNLSFLHSDVSLGGGDMDVQHSSKFSYETVKKDVVQIHRFIIYVTHCTPCSQLYTYILLCAKP